LQLWKTLDRTLVHRSGNGKFLILENHRVELPDGRIIEEWPWVITPDFVNVVAVTVDGEFICFRQTKYAADGITLAPVGGYLEPGEDPLAAAQRELLEETGYAAGDWTDLGRYVVDGNRGAGHAHLFLARNAQWVQPIDADDLEEQALLLLSRQAVEKALHNGEFQVVSWATAFALALLRLDGEDHSSPSIPPAGI
jgi:ADP-ribose pyrophosphatase